MAAHLQAAVAEATAAGIAGKAVTRFLLAAINRLTGARSLRSGQE
jgi:pseudouridine-5'-phosphate glycosidase